MKQILHLALLAALLVVPLTTKADNQSTAQKVSTKDDGLSDFLLGSMPCPDNTIYSEAIDLTVRGSGKGATRSDRGYEGISCQIYQSFEGNRNPIEGIRVFAISAGSNLYQADNARFHLDADGNMTQPLRLAVEFYTISNGYPGEQVYKEEVDVTGEKCDATYGSASKGDNVIDIYQFTINLSEKVRMENGYVSVYAVQGDTLAPSCFCIIHDNNIQHAGIITYHNWSYSEDVGAMSGGFNFCFLGDAQEPLAEKGLKLQRLISPETSETSPYATVQVELNNYGSTDIADATLRLYEGDELLVGETVGETIYAGALHKYTFRKRIDCSAVGTHTFTIENATPGNATLTDSRLTFTTTCTVGGDCSSQATYDGYYKYIKSVKLGAINCESGPSLYSDYRDQKTTIAPGQTLTLNIGTQSNNGDYLKVWVDWNGNGTFEDEGEFLGYVSNSNMTVAVPTNATATAGDRTLRIIVSNQDVSPCTTYTYGETEDYTLTVTAPEGSAAIQTDTKQVLINHPESTTITRQVGVSSTGEAELEADIAVEYRLPQSYDVSSIAKAPLRPQSTKPMVSMQQGLTSLVAQPSAKTTATATRPFVLTYGNASYSGNTGSPTTYVNYAHYYPGKALKAIAGMQISSIDVYIASTARKSFVAIWSGTGVQYINGNAIVKQEFTPTANAWNHVELSSPVTIDGSDLFIGCALEGCTNVQYQVGVDRGPANVGFGDLISTANSNYWWSLADLGYDNNVLIKANVTGERPAAIDWLTVDKTTLNVASGASDKLTLTASTLGLGQELYEAVVRIDTNDPLASSVKIPVYLDLYDVVTHVSLLESANEPAFRAGNGYIAVRGTKPVSYIALFTVDGRQLAQAFDTNSISTAHLGHGLYVVKAIQEDETPLRGVVCVK